MCNFNSSNVGAVVKAQGGVAISTTEADLKIAVATIGPISVAITVVNSFFSYASGVYYDSTCNNYGINHGGLITFYYLITPKDVN